MGKTDFSGIYDRMHQRVRAAKTDDERALLKMEFNAYLPLFGTPDPIPFYDPTVAKALTTAARARLHVLSDTFMFDYEALPQLDAVERDHRLDLPTPRPWSRDRW